MSAAVPATLDYAARPPARRVPVTGASGYVGGRLSWWPVVPFQAVIFLVMTRNILAEARRRARGTERAGAGRPTA